MLGHKPQPPVDPDQMMVGQCMSCKTQVRIERYKALPPKAPDIHDGGFSLWNECYMAECPNCKARVYLKEQ